MTKNWHRSSELKWMRDHVLKKYRGLSQEEIRNLDLYPTPDEFVTYILDQFKENGIQVQIVLRFVGVILKKLLVKMMAPLLAAIVNTRLFSMETAE